FGQLGYIYAALNRPSEASDAFTEALPRSSNQAAIHAGLAYASLALDDITVAIDQFERSLSLQDDPRLRRELALAYARAGNVDRAAQIVEDLRQTPDHDALLDADLWNQFADARFRDGRFREAAALFRQAAARDHGAGGPALSRAGESLERAGAFVEAA